MSLLSVNQSSMNRMFDELDVAVVAAARPAAQAGAQVFYDQVVRNVNALGRKTGNLASAVYQAYSKDKSQDGTATYHVSWNTHKAPHGHLIEFGHQQRYVTYVGEDGHFYTAKRADAKGKAKPGRKAPQAEKDAYYVALPAPRQVAAKPFLRPAYSKAPQALDAAANSYMRVVNGL